MRQSIFALARLESGERRNGVDSALIPDFAMEGDDATSSPSLPPDAGVVLLPSAAIVRRARQEQGFVKFDGMAFFVTLLYSLHTLP